jgi:hypothetical protein
MKYKFIILILCSLFLFGGGCAASKDYEARRGLMLLEPNEIPRNKPLKFSKKKYKKFLEKKHKKYQKKLKK